MFEFVNNRRLIYGNEKIYEITGILQWHCCKKAFLAVYDCEAEAVRSITKKLQDIKIDVVLYDQIKGEPDLEVINGARDLYLKEKCDCMIAIGGGSVIDTAKAANMLVANGGNVEEYQMEGRKVTKNSSLFIAVPTTAGTGAEATKTSVVTNNQNGLKKSLYHSSMIADIVILDPSLTVQLPSGLTAATGMDALSHGIESYVSLNATVLSQMYSLKAIQLVNENLLTAVNEPENILARGNMLLASYFGGCAISAGIGIAHIMAQPLGAMFHIPHGDACSIFLPASMELNMADAYEKYAVIAEVMGVLDSSVSSLENGMNAIKRVEELRSQIHAPEHLADFSGVKQADAVTILDIVKRTTGHITCNPRLLDDDLILTMYEKCL
jgi:alcohol dehydrogenase class IV